MSRLPGRSSNTWSWIQLSGEMRLGDAVGVLEFCGLGSDQDVQSLAVGLRMVGPIGLDRVPELFQPFLIGVAVLHDESGDAFGMLEGQSPAHRCPVIHHVHREARDADLIEEAVDELSEAIEGIGELRTVRHVALAVAGIVRSDHMIAVRERGDQVAEHVRRCRKAVEQQHDRSGLRSRLAIENLDAVDLLRPVVGDDGRRLRRTRAMWPRGTRGQYGKSQQDAPAIDGERLAANLNLCHVRILRFIARSRACHTPS
jgi:hypothetical protein